MKKAIIAFIMLAALFTTAINAQVQIAGGENYKLDALPANFVVSMTVGENRSFTLEENLAVGLWSARTANPLQQIVITHQLEDATGGVAVNPGVATIRIIGNVAGDNNVDLVLSKPGAPVDVAPAAVLHCRVIAVAPAPVVVAPQQPVVVPPQPVIVPPQPGPIVVAPTAPASGRVISIENEYYYEMPQIPQKAEFKLRKIGGEINFYLESKERDGWEWHAIYDHDKIQVIVDNDYNGPARRFGHKNPRETRGTHIQVNGFDPCDTRLILEYRKRHHDGRTDRPIKVMECFVKVR
ncbi:MAG: hypothetical protein IKZ46_18025 [Victivallales bacterium]|nr:hypothetical protein [Victivallales bacterium]